MKRSKGFACFIIFTFLSTGFFAAHAQNRSNNLRWIGEALNSAKTIDGYYVSLPEAYNNTATPYPVIIYLHGDESVDDGYTAILNNGIPALITQNAFPESFKVSGRNYQFIIIAPHFNTRNISEAELEEAITPLLQRYRIDRSRVYMTGMSRGGGLTWQFAGSNAANAASLAAIVPVAGAATPQAEKASIIGQADLPVLATHNDEDYLVPASNSITWVEWVNAEKPQPRADLKLFKSNKHEGWTETFDPAFKHKGKNIYEWMLQYTRSDESVVPVKLVRFEARKVDNHVVLSWLTAGDVPSGFFTIERAADGQNFQKLGDVVATENLSYVFIDAMPLNGINYYRLSQTEPDGKVTYFPSISFQYIHEGATLRLAPNPTPGAALLEMNHAATGTFYVRLHAASGQALQQWSIEKTGSSFQKKLDFTLLPPGRYMLQITGNGFKETLSFIRR